ncbi:hypothetical protein PUN28_011217 [Cardiocondyla obscurior]|uniref:Uncharacterized protein n=1 Tax=Cardiocondyla obscurior TaxID=286306 RepID=A0AAW2FMG8_9HYME
MNSVLSFLVTQVDASARQLSTFKKHDETTVTIAMMLLHHVSLRVASSSAAVYWPTLETALYIKNIRTASTTRVKRSVELTQKSLIPSYRFFTSSVNGMLQLAMK